MEQIKDMVTLRQVSMTLATDAMKSIVTTTKHYDVNNHLDIAKIIAQYILGGTKLPGLYDEKAQIESWKKIIFDAMPKDMQSQWFKPEDIKPKDGAKVLVYINDSDKVYFGSYDGSQWILEIDNGLVTENDGKFTVVAWLPIPEYKGQTI